VMTHDDIATVDELWTAACGRFPLLSPAEQRGGIALLRELSRGAPVAIAELARMLDLPVDTAEALVKDSALSPFVHTGEAGRIQGFWGLSVTHTHHQLTVDGRRLWTWCAFDSLFMRELLGDTAEIESRDPETGELARLTVSPARVETAEPSGVVLSMMPPDAWDFTSAARVIASACHFIFFFASRTSGEHWRARHSETVLLSLDDAFALAKRQNAHLFGPELARCRAD
ncbi:MAG: organomercurial lyase, partial [Steroidobacteraceae bacterium]